MLPPFPEKLQRYTKKRLEEMGVEIRVNTLAIDMDHESITVKGPDGVETIRARTRIWAAGVQASPLAKMLAEKAGVEADRAGRIPVEPDCTLPGHPEVFAIGDMVSLNKLPGVAQPAMQEGKYVGKVIKARLAGEPVEPFKYFDKGTMATIGYRSAVADAFGDQAHRLPRLPDLGASSTSPTWWAGATGSAPCTPGPAGSGSGTAGRTGSSPSSRPTRTSPRATCPRAAAGDPAAGHDLGRRRPGRC